MSRYSSAVSHRARTFLGLVLCVAAAAIAAPASALAGDPVVVPVPDSKGYTVTQTPACYPLEGSGTTQADGANPWRNCLLPATNAVVDWPTRPNGTVDPFYWPSAPTTGDLRANGFRTTRSFILEKPGQIATWLGALNTDTGYPLFWYDVGSGIPFALPSTGMQFLLSGKYEWECGVCSGVERQKLQGTMYVLGPRVIVKPKLVSADNSGTAITYAFDASGSFVTDYTPVPSIVEYAFDFEDDGTFDQTSPEPSGTSTFTPGAHTINVRVKDSTGRTADYPLFLEVPFVKAGNPEPNPVADNGPGTLNPTGVKFSKANVKLKAVKSIRISVLNRKGITVKVTGLTKDDRVKVKLLKGKRALASKTATTATSTKTFKLKLNKQGRKRFYAGGIARRLVLNVDVEGADGFTTTQRLGVKVK